SAVGSFFIFLMAELSGQPMLPYSFLAGVLFGTLFFFARSLTRSFQYTYSSFFTSNILKYSLGIKGINKFRKTLLSHIKELQDYRIFIIQNNQVISYPDHHKLYSKSMLIEIDQVFHKAFPKPYLLPQDSINFTIPQKNMSCYSYAYQMPFFNSRMLILAYFDSRLSVTRHLHEQMHTANDLVANLLFFSETSGESNDLMSLLQEVVWQSPYAFGITNPKGELIFGNNALYQLFKGTIPNFLELVDPEVFILLLDGNKIGKTFRFQGQNIHLEAFPMNNKNFLVTKCLFIFYDVQVEYKRDLLGESNSLKRFTSEHPSIGTAMFTVEGKLLYSNESFINQLDIVKVREAKQKDIFDLFKISEEEYQNIVTNILIGEEQTDNLISLETEHEFEVRFKGLVFGDQTIVELILQNYAVFSDNLSFLDSETLELYQELQTARSVQEHILALPPLYRPGVSVDTLYMPSRQLSGDFYTLIPFEDDQMGILIADVSGHGVSASLITAALKILIEFAPNDPKDLSKIIEYFNAYLADILPEGSFVTLFYGIINFEDYTLKYINCGHPFPVVEDLEQNQTIILEGMGFPLGGLLNVAFDELIYTIQLPHRSKILLYTDGLIQYLTGSIKDRILKACDVMQKYKGINDKKMLELLYKQLVSRNTPVAEDDVSLMLINLDKEQTKRHHLSIASTLLEVDTVIVELTHYIQKEISASSSFFWKLRTCLYEALLNAVVHGNKYNTQKRVYIDYRISNNFIAIRIKDEGNGFVSQDIDNPLNPENLLKDFGRGITMVKHLAHKVKFNHKGNEILLFFITGSES
ncbi:MAG: ATP-binding SpoIIE family protein phosphatase, partial [Brevinema sp.]